jgi:uncharacterized phage protein (TIGR02218 family)
MPRAISTELQSHLDTGTTTLCWCYEINRTDGVIMGFTDHDQNVTFDSVTFEALSGFTGSEIHENVGLGIDNIDVQGALSSDKIKEIDILNGLYDDAAIYIYRVNWLDVTQRVLMKRGSLGELTRSNLSFKAEVRGISHYLNQPIGRVYQFNCDVDLGSAKCGVNIVTYTSSGTILSIIDDRIFTVSGSMVASANDFYNRGKLTWTSGNNNGKSIEIKHHRKVDSIITIEIWQQAINTVLIGDTFSIQAGCDKRPKTCRDQFNNFANYRGFPYMPGNDYVSSYVNSDDADKDGSSRGNIFE